MAFTDVFGGSSIYPSDATYISLVLTADVELSWPIEQQIGGPLIVADIIDLNAGQAGLSVFIPDARNATQGFTTLFNNVGPENVTIRNALGGTLATIVPGSAWQLYLTDNSTESGVWRSFQYGASISVANAAALVGNGLINIGVALSLNFDVTEVNTTPFALDANARARIFDWTSGAATFELPSAATLGDGWFTILRNSGSGDITVEPVSGTIDGGPDKTVAPGGSLIVVSNGANYITLISAGGGGGAGFNLLVIDISGAGDYTLSGVELNQVGYRLVGALSGTRNVIVPGTIAQYWIDNATDASPPHDVFIKTAAQSPGVNVLNATRNILYCDGTNVVSAESSSVSFPIAVANGGTGEVTAAAAMNTFGATRTITAGTGLTGGGALSADITISLNALVVVPPSRTITAGVGLSGGGDLSTNRTIDLDADLPTGTTIDSIPVGYMSLISRLLTTSGDVAQTDNGRAIRMTGTGGETLGLANLSSGTIITLINLGAAARTINIIPANDIVWLSGGSIQGGSRSLAAGSVATVWRAPNGDWYIWGNGIS